MSFIDVKKLKETYSIVDVVDHFVGGVYQVGQNYLALCPFHDDKHPSLGLNNNSNYYHCWSCGESGDIISFVKKYKGVGFGEALKLIKAIDKDKKLSVKLIKRDGLDYQRRGSSERVMEADFLNHIWKLLPDVNHKFASKFEMTEKLASDFQLKIVLFFHKKNLASLLKEKYDYDNETLLASGLFFNKHNSKELLFLYNNMMLFPYFDSNNNVISFVGRTLLSEAEREQKEFKYRPPKYRMCNNYNHFQKRLSLYNMQKALQAHIANPLDPLIICEGYRDVIALDKIGVKKVVGLGGVALTLEHCFLLNRVMFNNQAEQSANIYLMLDGDEAGIKASQKALEMLKNNVFNACIVPEINFKNDLYYQKKWDPAELVNKIFINDLNYYEENYLQTKAWPAFLRKKFQKAIKFKKKQKKVVTLSKGWERERKIIN